MTKKKENKITTEDIMKEGQKIIEQMNEPGTWDDLKKLRVELKTYQYIIHGRVYPISVREIGWGERNQISEKLSKNGQLKSNPIMYKRTMQEEVIKRRVVEIAGHRMQTSEGIPNEAEWHSLPQDLGEFLRTLFYNDTGEYGNLLVQGTGFTDLEQLKAFIDALVSENKTKPEGIQTQEDVTLKN